MTERGSYKTTLFDRLGPDAAHRYKAMAWGLAMGLVFFLISFVGATDILGLATGRAFLLAFLLSVLLGGLVAWLPVLAGETSEKVWSRVVVSGVSTPYTEQYSYQQALVMQGRVDEAISTLEATIAEAESTVDVRIRAAELHTREAKNHVRAAELFREAIRHPKCTPGEEVYAANRLVDLLNGPLGQPGRALVELRRLADRYPNSAVGENAKLALRTLKAAGSERDPFGPPVPGDS